MQHIHSGLREFTLVSVYCKTGDIHMQEKFAKGLREHGCHLPTFDSVREVRSHLVTHKLWSETLFRNL